jgi:hypothetical protein
MARHEAIRAEVVRLRRAVPFQPFALTLENGNRIIIGHPENIAFDPPAADGSGASIDFYVLSNQVRLYSTFKAVTSVGVLVDNKELAS